jgi:hypothetical protein
MKYLILSLLLSFLGCKNGTRVLSDLKTESLSTKDHLGDYWYQGKAEITTYHLKQNRYEDIHPGEVVMIFVTEDFLTDVQVKNDQYRNTNSTSILKNNKISRFTTGIYDYSMMTSTFTPVNRNEFPHTLKVTMSSQDWCGQSYQQLNFQDGKYVSELHSYFEKEADRNTAIEESLIEDEIVNLIRFGPESLPTGELFMIPSLCFLRLKHIKEGTYKAINSLNDYDGDEWNNKSTWQYVIKYPDLHRTVTFYIDKRKPYKILGWDDSYPSSFDGKVRSSKARKQKEEMIAYWNKNSANDFKQRTSLGLSVYKRDKLK